MVIRKAGGRDILMILTIRILFSKESTEGVDKAAENQKLADELLKELDQDT